jgi:hypothetical protein
MLLFYQETRLVFSRISSLLEIWKLLHQMLISCTQLSQRKTNHRFQDLILQPRCPELNSLLLIQSKTMVEAPHWQINSTKEEET